MANIYEIDCNGATDVSQSPFDAGRDGETFTQVGKQLLSSVTVGAAGGENLEGLALGPRLPNGNWVMLGVVNNGDPLSSNTIVSLEIAPVVPIAMAPDTSDYDEDADVDGHDFLRWQRGLGVTTLAGLNDGDGNPMVKSTAMTWRYGRGLMCSPCLRVPRRSQVCLSQRQQGFSRWDC